MRKSDRENFGNLDEKNLCDNKSSWSVVKPRLLYKVVTNAIIILVEDNTVVDNDKKTATNLNKFSSNKFINPQYNETEPLSQDVDNPLIKV